MPRTDQSTVIEFEAFETINMGTNTIVFSTKIPPVHVMLANDDPREDLQFRFGSAVKYGTLLPRESLNLAISVKNITLKSTRDVAYRLWVFS